MEKARAVGISKLLSLALRHEPQVLGLVLDPQGRAPVSAVLRASPVERQAALRSLSRRRPHPREPGLHAFGRGRRPRVEVVAADAAQALALVRRGEAHVGVGVLSSTPADLEVTVLARAAQLVVVPRTRRLAKRRRIALSDLAGEDLIVPLEGGPQRALLDALLASHGIEVHASATARGWDVVLKLAELGVGLGIVNATCVIPRALRGIPVRDLPVVTYVAFTRCRPPAQAAALVRAFVAS